MVSKCDLQFFDSVSKDGVLIPLPAIGAGLTSNYCRGSDPDYNKRCHGWYPKIHVHPEPVSEPMKNLFRNRVYADVIQLKWKSQGQVLKQHD